MFEAILGGVLIFLLRLCDVPIGTLRVMLMVQGRRLPAVILAVLESTIWVIAISSVLSRGALNDPFRVAGFAFGFAAGTALGMTAEKWLAFGKTLVRIISRTHSEPLRQRLFDEDYGTTAIEGRGREGTVLILFVVIPRKRLRNLLTTIREVDPHAFVTHEPVAEAIGGYLPSMAAMDDGKR